MLISIITDSDSFHIKSITRYNFPYYCRLTNLLISLYWRKNEFVIRRDWNEFTMNFNFNLYKNDNVILLAGSNDVISTWFILIELCNIHIPWDILLVIIYVSAIKRSTTLWYIYQIELYLNGSLWSFYTEKTVRKKF